MEGTFYISTGALISAQTIMPALIKRLGGGDVLIGTWPVVVYLAFFLPQVISANNSGTAQYRKPIVIRLGLIQRLHILLLACAIAVWGETSPTLALIVLFLLFISNQATAGYVSPIWMDFLVKTTSPENRGRLAGWRTSFAAILGLLNGFVLTMLMTMLRFPYNYASAIGLSFLYQFSSLLVQRKIVEESPSVLSAPVRLSELFARMHSLVAGNPLFRKFLIASSLIALSFSAAAFFTVDAIKQFDLSESVIGIFTVFTIIGQILSGVVIGWIADMKGTKIALIICGASLVLSIIAALCAPSVIWFYAVFLFLGINIGAELFMRYNFAVECAPDEDRPMYIGIMNAWLAPFYLITPFAGWLSAVQGYHFVFWIALVIGCCGIVLLLKMEDPRAEKLALSSK
jgi:MFS family permease